MAEFLLSKRWGEIRAMSFEEISKLPCIEIVNDDGQPKERFGVFLMVPTTDYIQKLCDYRGELSNSLLPPAEQAKKEQVEIKIEPAKKRKKRKTGRKSDGQKGEVLTLKR